MTEHGAKLVGDFNDACFECGEWTKDSDEPYEPVYARQAEAEAKLVAYIEGLEAACQFVGCIGKHTCNEITPCHVCAALAVTP